MTFAKDSFIKWTSEDEAGRFSHTGQVVSCTDDRVTFITSPNAGPMSVPLDEGRFRSVSKPANWDDQAAKANIEQLDQPKAPKKSRGSKGKVNSPKSGSKKERAIEIYRQMAEDDHPDFRAAVIQVFIDQLDMTPAGAATYYAMAKKLT